MQVVVSGTGVAAADGIELAYSLTELRLLLLLVLAGLGYLLVVGQAYSLVVELGYLLAVGQAYSLVVEPGYLLAVGQAYSLVVELVLAYS